MTATAAAPKRESQTKVAFATLVGTTIEWYDFFIYAQAAGLVFATLFFEPAGAQIALLLSFASVGISFLFRPLGAFLAGHYGDKLGRRLMLVLTLVLMGAATTLIGLLLRTLKWVWLHRSCFCCCVFFRVFLPAVSGVARF